MAKLNYTWEQIEKLPAPATEGEKYLLHWLENNLDENYEVYFQPYLNGDRPDILILRRKGGVVVIEVKDYNMDCYRIKNEDEWSVNTGSGGFVDRTSPIAQIKRYKNNLINLHIGGMAEAVVHNKFTYACIVSAIYLHNASINDLNGIVNHPTTSEETRNYISFFCKDNLDRAFVGMLDKNYINGRSRFFTDELYNNCKVWVSPLDYEKELANPYEFTDFQKELGAVRDDNKYSRITGVAGSGKTTMLALKAVNSYLKAEKKATANGKLKANPVLIITFNITLRNYIQDRISMVCRMLGIRFDKSCFEIIHYHNFLPIYCNNNSILLNDADGIDDFVMPNLDTKEYKEVDRYDTILVDETQDFKSNWIDNLKRIKAKDGKIYFYADLAQRIYSRDLTNARFKNFYHLKNTFRLDSDIVDLANDYGTSFLSEHREINYREQNLFEEKNDTNILYCDVENGDYNTIIEKFSELIKAAGMKHPNDFCFLGNYVDTLRSVAAVLEKKYNLRLETTFESQNTFEKLCNTCIDEDQLKKAIYRIRRSKKYHFWDNSGCLRLSTIHSFKGWEITNGVIFLEEGRNEEIPIDTLLFVALTRVRKNLLIINLGKGERSDFLRRWVAERKRCIA